jgi:hypothetical protein
MRSSCASSPPLVLDRVQKEKIFSLRFLQQYKYFEEITELHHLFLQMAARQKRLHVLVQDLARDLRMRSDSTVAASSSRYMRDQFPFLGVRSPIRRQVQKAVFAKHALKDDQELAAVLKQLWKMKEREFQYAAIDLADKHQHLYTQGRTPPYTLSSALAHNSQAQSSLCLHRHVRHVRVHGEEQVLVGRTSYPLACLCTQLCG